MKVQKVISIIAIVASLTLIIYMCAVMAINSGDTEVPGNNLLITTPSSGSDSTPASGDAQTQSPGEAAPGTESPTVTGSPESGGTTSAPVTAPPDITAVPGGKTSANPAYAGKKIIAITFDDGPHGTNTPKILDMLKEKGVHVTFFVLGENLQSSGQKAILKREFDEGHEIASHSFNHPDFKTLSADERASQLQRTDDIIREVTGSAPVLFRPPYGNYNQDVSVQSGKAIVLWSIDSRDWDHISAKSVSNYASANGISQDEAKDKLINDVLFDGFTYTSGGKEYTNPSVVSQLSHGSIILFHDIHPYSGEAVGKLIDYLKQTGEYEMMTVSQMIETEQRAPQAGDVYAYMWETYATQKKNW